MSLASAAQAKQVATVKKLTDGQYEALARGADAAF